MRNLQASVRNAEVTECRDPTEPRNFMVAVDNSEVRSTGLIGLVGAGVKLCSEAESRCLVKKRYLEGAGRGSILRR